MKKVLCLVIAMCLILGVVTVLAEEETQRYDDFIYITTGDRKLIVDIDILPGRAYMVSNYENEWAGRWEMKVKVPYSVDGMVFELGKEAFCGEERIAKLIFEEGFTTIPEGLCREMPNLEEVVLPASVVEICSDAFRGCPKLSKINLGNAEIIGEGAFADCGNIKNIIIPDTVKSIGRHAFAGCTSLEEIVIPSSVSSLHQETFVECRKLKKVVLGEGVADIEAEAFLDCEIEKLVILGENTKIQSQERVEFYSKGALKWYYVFPSFYRTYIGEIFAPSGSEAEKFANRNGINFVPYEENIEHNYGDFIIVENEDNITITQVTKSDLVNVTIPGEINGKKVTLSPRLFEGMESLESVTIEEGVVEIPENTFHKCINLKNVKLPNTLETIGEWAFRESGLNEIELPNGVIAIGNSAFYRTKITSVRIPEKVTILSNYTFSGCKQLTLVDLNNVEIIGQGAFSECTKLERVVHSGNLIKLESFAFENCPVLNEIDIKNVKVFGGRVFYGNEKIEYMNLQSIEEAEIVKDDYIQGEENPYFVGEWYIQGSGISSPLSFSSFSGMMALKTARVNLSDFKTQGIGVLFFRTPQLDTIIYENFSPEVTGKWLCHEYDLSKPRNANLVLYGNEDVKAYAESIGVPFKELIDVNLNGEQIWMDDCLPYIKNDRTMVPMRAIFEALGAEVSWDDVTKTAIGVKEDIEVKITIGENKLYKNGVEVELDCAAEITNDRTMVPVRAISEAFGCVVNWNNYDSRVEIFTEDAKDKHWYFYDENDRIIYTMHGNGGWERFEYDAYGNRTASRSHIGDAEYTYDEEGRVILKVTSVGYRVEITYDENGNMIKRRSTNERFNQDDTEEYTYNEKGQLVTRKTDVITYTYIYDEAGNNIETKLDIGGSDKYTYDERGNLIEENRKNGEWIKYTYDAMDNRTSITYSSGKWEKYEYDDQGKQIREEWSDGTVKTYTYDENGNKIFVSYTGGLFDGECYRYEYNEIGQVTYYETYKTSSPTE